MCVLPLLVLLFRRRRRRFHARPAHASRANPATRRRLVATPARHRRMSLLQLASARRPGFRSRELGPAHDSSTHEELEHDHLVSTAPAARSIGPCACDPADIAAASAAMSTGRKRSSTMCSARFAVEARGVCANEIHSAATRVMRRDERSSRGDKGISEVTARDVAQAAVHF